MPLLSAPDQPLDFILGTECELYNFKILYKKNKIFRNYFSEIVIRFLQNLPIIHNKKIFHEKHKKKHVPNPSRTQFFTKFLISNSTAVGHSLFRGPTFFYTFGEVLFVCRPRQRRGKHCTLA